MIRIDERIVKSWLVSDDDCLEVGSLVAWHNKSFTKRYMEERANELGLVVSKTTFYQPTADDCHYSVLWVCCRV
jgi:hypothetical protein